MKKIQINEDVLFEWMRTFSELNGNSPGLNQMYRHKGCPYSKMVVFNKYKSIDNLYKKFNGHKRKLGYDCTPNIKLLENLKYYVFKYKTTDRDILRSKGLYDRSVYERRFGSWAKAIQLAGIDNRHRLLLKYFSNYNDEDPITFLKSNLGKNNDFTDKQYALIKRVQDMGNNPTLIRNSIRYNLITKDFIYVSLLLIASGFTPTVNFATGNRYISLDGHKCDSRLELIVDDFLYNNCFPHEVHVNYPNSKMKCDFTVYEFYIEFAGLTDKKNYLAKLNRKIKLAEELGLKLIIIYNTDINSLEHLKEQILNTTLFKR